MTSRTPLTQVPLGTAVRLPADYPVAARIGRSYTVDEFGPKVGGIAGGAHVWLVEQITGERIAVSRWTFVVVV
jgi:hypothetical protein